LEANLEKTFFIGLAINMESKKFKVASIENGMRLLAFLRKKYTAAPSVKSLKRAIEHRGCRINGKMEIFSTHLLNEGDNVEIELSVDCFISRPSILWEDDYLAVYDKPPGVVSEGKSFSALLVHRLDKETSGAIVVAKRMAAVGPMEALFKQRKVCKEYLAIVDGHVSRKKGVIISKISPKRYFQGQTIYGSDFFGKEAITNFEVIAFGEKSTFLLCKPVTGRTHQIRVHLKEEGHPILGDYQYSSVFRAPLLSKRHLLHAYKIDFYHPMKKNQHLQVIAPIPSDFFQALQSLGMAHTAEFLYKEKKD
jgi:23S rRNA pseudouridine955/2504/2580 synthase